eukprot:2776201-Rhodomonas_salina.1
MTTAYAAWLSGNGHTAGPGSAATRMLTQLGNLPLPCGNSGSLTCPIASDACAPSWAPLSPGLIRVPKR